MTNVSRQPICSLQAQMQNTIIIGVIIRSQNSKIIDSSRTRYNLSSRAVWNFTLRDSINDFINATAWGSVDYINNLFISFPLGSVVEVINAKISERKVDDMNEVYVPSVTSQFTLTVNQSSSLIQIHRSPSTIRYQHLLRMPTKNPAGVVSLSYILENTEILKNQFVDIIVGVTFVSQTREIVTRMGELTKIREFEVSDASTDQVVSLTLWDMEWIKFADKWEPKNTVLFIADAQIIFNDRMKKSMLTIVRKTIITENPDISDAEKVRVSLHSKPDTGSMSPFAIPNPNSITKQMTIIEITNRLNYALSSQSEERLQLLVIVHAIVDDINIDSKDPTLISERCAKCKRVVTEGRDTCMNLECPFGSGLKSPMNTISLNILVNLKDDTGYLIGCRLKDLAAEQTIGCSAEMFLDMPPPCRLKLKEKYYKNLCKVRLQIIGPSISSRKPVYNILAMNVIELNNDGFEPLNIDELDSICN